MTNPNQENGKPIDFKKKGLGWIPDYPDLRDYRTDDDNTNGGFQFHKNGRLNLEQSVATIESLTGDLLIALRQLNQDSLQDIIQSIEDKVFGNLRFISVQLRKSLSYSSDQLVSKVQTASSEESKSRNQQILLLKNYLYILFLKSAGHISPNEFNAGFRFAKNSEYDQSSLNPVVNLFDVEKSIAWLRDENFDQTTERLVILFQYCLGIRVDGIVGLQTYNALEKCLAKETSLAGLQTYLKPCLNNLKNCAWEIQNLPQLESLDEIEIQLLSLPSLIPEQILGLLTGHLLDSAAKNIQEELKKTSSQAHEDCCYILQHELSAVLSEQEQKDLEIGFSSVFPATHDVLRQGSHTVLVNEKKLREAIIKDWEIALLGKQGLAQRSRQLLLKKNSKIINENYRVLEPLVTVILKLVTPISQEFKNLSQAFESGIQRFYQLLPVTRLDNLGLDEPILMPDLAWAAIHKVAEELEHSRKLFLVELKRLKQEVEQLKQEVEQKYSDSKSQCLSRLKLEEKQFQLEEKQQFAHATFLFYFLVGQLVNPLIQSHHRGDSDLIARKNNTEVFDNKELFEITNLYDLYPGKIQGHSHQAGEEKIEVFPASQIHIPVSKIIGINHGLKYSDPKIRKYIFLPKIVDLSIWCSAIEDQGPLNACAAFAGISLFEYFENRSRDKYTDLSALFLYKATRNLMGLTDDLGSSLRDTMKAMTLFGVPPEKHWPYNVDKVNEEPENFCYSYAQNYQALKYFRLDYSGITKDLLLAQIKALLATGFPCMFGLTLYSSAYEEANLIKGYIPFPSPKRDKVIGGHALVAVGYDDFQQIQTADLQAISQGAVLVRNCWGKDWGANGYGWLPYDYILQGLTRDWWSLLKSEWFEDEQFGSGASSSSVTGETVIPWPK